MSERAAALNADCHSAQMDRSALHDELCREGKEICDAVNSRTLLFSDTVFFVNETQMAQMRAVIDAVEGVVKLPGWLAPESGHERGGEPRAHGVFYGYDFHLNDDGAHLIEVNTNAGGGFINAVLLRSQRDIDLPGELAALENIEQAFIEMFRSEWRIEQGERPLQTVLIVDDDPPEQYLYPDFLIAKRMLEHAGITALIADPSACERRAEGLYCQGQKVDLVYNRLTDFTFAQQPALLAAWQARQVVITPNPENHARHADKRNLVRLSDPEALRALGAGEEAIAALQAGVPQTRVVNSDDRDQWWAERKQWFFKPAAGFGAKATYRGANITRRVFEEIMQAGDYVAQRLAPPGERMVCEGDAEPAAYKSDVRCYVYEGEIQLVVARLYQGQTTNFRTPGGGFAPVRVV